MTGERGIMGRINEEVGRKARIAAAAGALVTSEGCMPEACAPDKNTFEMTSQETQEQEESESTEIISEYFDSNPSSFTFFKNGEMPEEEREARTETLPNGEEVFRDIGVTFYKVKKGDTLSGIRKKLTKYDEFAYLNEIKSKITGFNIPAKVLQIGMWLPIPLNPEVRALSDEQFTLYADRGIDELLENELYGEKVQKVLEKVSREELVATLVALAKQESGNPIGTLSLHRYEKKYKSFSYSYFHILMDGAGLNARKKLGMTEGQLYHPQNGAKLALAFICEKTSAPERLFPIDEHAEDLAKTYNGGGWRNFNPDYADDVTKFYREAVEGMGERKASLGAE